MLDCAWGVRGASGTPPPTFAFSGGWRRAAEQPRSRGAEMLYARGVASLVAAVKDIDRLRQISTVLVKHGFGEIVGRIGLGGGKSEDGEEKRLGFAERLRLVALELGPSFIKLGQIVSTRPDLIPADVIAELAKLQDRVPPMSIADVRGTISETLGAPAEEIFAEFENEPL